jgi:tRNA G18 (ribose-2'-O)-methylase SpoU
MRSIIVIAHNIRSTHNVGALFRTCDGFGVEQLILSGYSPYPLLPHDTRLPHLAQAITRRIHKTALGAETYVPFCHQPTPDIEALRRAGYRIVGLEQDPQAVELHSYRPPMKIALIIGEEVAGIADDIRRACDDLLEITMTGKKESLNVSVATGIALYHLQLP